MTTNADKNHVEIIREALESAVKRLTHYDTQIDRELSLLAVKKALATLESLHKSYLSQVKVPDELVLAPKELIKALAHHGVDTGYGIYQIERKHIQEARELLSTQEPTP